MKTERERERGGGERKRGRKRGGEREREVFGGRERYIKMNKSDMINRNIYLLLSIF